MSNSMRIVPSISIYMDLVADNIGYYSLRPVFFCEILWKMEPYILTKIIRKTEGY